MVLFESCRYEAMKQCWLSYGTSQSDLSENYLTPVILATVMLILLVFFCCWIVHVVLMFLLAGSGSFIN